MKTSSSFNAKIKFLEWHSLHVWLRNFSPGFMTSQSLKSCLVIKDELSPLLLDCNYCLKTIFCIFNNSLFQCKWNDGLITYFILFYFSILIKLCINIICWLKMRKKRKLKAQSTKFFLWANTNLVWMKYLFYSVSSQELAKTFNRCLFEYSVLEMLL